MAENGGVRANGDIDTGETREWLGSLHAVLAGVETPSPPNTPYINTTPADRQPPFPGSREIERRIKSLIRWNAMAMVVRANKHEDGIGGPISHHPAAATAAE